MQIFKKKFPEGFKSCFDTEIQWWRSWASGIFRNFGKRFDLRRVTAILLQRKNFGDNVIYYLLGATERSHATFQKMPQKALNRILTLANYSTGLGLLISSGIIDLQNNSVCKQFKHWKIRIAVPMSDISFWEHCWSSVTAATTAAGTASAIATGHIGRGRASAGPTFQDPRNYVKPARTP